MNYRESGELNPVKRCSRCTQSKLLEEFGKNRSNSDGLSCACRQCRKEDRKLSGADKAYNQRPEVKARKLEWERKPENKSKKNEYSKEYQRQYLSNPENVAKRKERRKTYIPRYKIDEAAYEERRESLRKYYQENREKIIAKSREYWEQHREYTIDYGRQYYEKNRDTILEKRRDNPIISRVYCHKRRALKSNSTGQFTKLEWENLCQQYDYKCLRCGQVKPLTVDHVIPLTKGGTNDIGNIQPLCYSCNSSKRSKSTDYREANHG